MNHPVIFLGGSCNPTTWRQNVAIPYLETNGITYYNPQVDDWTPEVVKNERQAKQNAKVLLFVIDSQTRSTVSLVESAYLAGDNKKLVLVIYPFDFDFVFYTDATEQTSNVVETCEETFKTSFKSVHNNTKSPKLATAYERSSCSTTTTLISSTTKHASETRVTINGEAISFNEYSELKQGRSILRTLLAKSKIPLFSDILQALNYISHNLNDSSFCCRRAESQLKSDNNEAEPINDQSNLQNSDSYFESISNFENKDVYLSFDETDESVRSTIIPVLLKRGLTFGYVPSVQPRSGLTEEPANCFYNISHNDSKEYSDANLQVACDQSTAELESQMNAIQNSRVLLFVITNKCRGLSVMVLASHFIALSRENVVLCIQYLDESSCINGETLSKSAVSDYNRGRVYLWDYATKAKVPVFSTIEEAVDCCTKKFEVIKEFGV